MKYLCMLSLLLFTQLSWSVDENIKRIQDPIDTLAKTRCKDHQNPETCEIEYKELMQRLDHVDTSVKTHCKDYRYPGICETEYKNLLRILGVTEYVSLKQIFERLGFPVIEDPSPRQTLDLVIDAFAKDTCEDNHSPKTCETAFKDYIKSTYLL